MRWLDRIRDASITRKLSLAFLLVVVLIVVMGGFAIYRLAAINATTVEMRTNWLIGIRELGEADSLLADERRLLNAHLLADTDTVKATFEKQLDAGRGRFREVWEKYGETVTQADEKALVEAFLREHQRYQREEAAVLALSRRNQTVDARALLMSAASPAQEAARAAMKQLIDYNQHGADTTTAEAAALFDSGRQVMVALMLVVALIAIALVWLLRRLLLEPILGITRVMGVLASGKLDIEVPYRERKDEVGQMAQALVVLHDSAQAQQRAAWVKTQSGELLAAVQGVDDLAEFARRLMARLTPLLSAQVGIFYYRAPQTSHYCLLGSHAYLHRKGMAQQFAVGEGLVGQCVLERAPITLSALAPDYIQIASGLGQAPSRFLLVAPLITASGEIPAVIEIASLARFGEREQALLDEVLPMLALGIDTLERNSRTRELLEQTKTLLAQRDALAQAPVEKGA